MPRRLASVEFSQIDWESLVNFFEKPFQGRISRNIHPERVINLFFVKGNAAVTIGEIEEFTGERFSPTAMNGRLVKGGSKFRIAPCETTMIPFRARKNRRYVIKIQP